MTHRLNIAAAACLFGAGTLILATSGATASPDSPLSAWRGFGHNEDTDMVIFTNEFAEREALVAQCMNGQGFEYKQRTLENDPQTLQVNDPNDQMVQRLSESDTGDYFIALLGEADPNLITGDLDSNRDGTVDYEESFGDGCSGDAHREVLGVFAAKAILTEEYNELRLSVRKSPTVVEAEQRWLGCASQVGIDGDTRTSALEKLDADGKLDSPDIGSLVEKCDDPFRQAVQAETGKLEAEFVKEHADVLEKYGVKN